MVLCDGDIIPYRPSVSSIFRVFFEKIFVYTIFALPFVVCFLSVTLTAGVSERDGTEQLTKGKGKSENFEKKRLKVLTRNDDMV